MSTSTAGTDRTDRTDSTDRTGAVEPLDDDAVQQPLEVRRDGPLSLLVGGSAGVVAVAFLLRAVGSGTLLDWGLFLATGAIAAMHLAAVVDARAPLVVLDRHGVRLRRGATWQGVAWSEVDHVEHRARVTTLRDGSLAVVTTDARRLGVRLSLSTRLVGADWHEVDEALRDLSGGAVPVVGPERDAPGDDAADDGAAPAADEPVLPKASVSWARVVRKRGVSRTSSAVSS